MPTTTSNTTLSTWRCVDTGAREYVRAAQAGNGGRRGASAKAAAMAGGEAAASVGAHFLVGQFCLLLCVPGLPFHLLLLYLLDLRLGSRLAAAGRGGARRV